MAVFEPTHQDTIDRINHDGWQYLVSRISAIGDEFGGNAFADHDDIGIQVNGVEVCVEPGEPQLEWTLVRDRFNCFTSGFRLSVGAHESSLTNRVICKPADWYMLCISLQIGLNMAQLGLAATKVDYAAN